ncbi:acylphosphatase [Candidatus Woesearchaeota archaeon]|nr:acylphosphatase [Candidatus Woesearchaeota archaeon]
MRRTHLIITGRVQGVLFRANTKKHAEKIGVKGWVRNLNDDKVEAVGEGTKEQIKDFVAYCSKGPEEARVDDIVLEDEEYKGEFKGFVIRY